MNLDPRAVEYIDKKSEEIYCFFAPINLQNNNSGQSQFPEPFIENHITEKEIIGTPQMSVVNPLGQEEIIYFADANQQLIGLHGENIQAFHKFSEQIEKSCKYLVSKGFIVNSLREYYRKKFNNELSADSYGTIFSKEVEAELTEKTVILPINGLIVETEIKIKDTRIVPIGQADITDWFSESSAQQSPENLLHRETMIQQMRRDHQGLAAAVTIISAESEAAIETATERAKKAISILRIFSPANFHPRLVSYADTWGASPIQTYKVILKNKPSNLQIKAGMLQKGGLHWQIDRGLLSQMMRDGLSLVIEIYEKEKKTDFEQLILEAIWLYTQSSLKVNIYEKLLYIFAALEKLLVKDEKESLQQNIGERLARLIYTTVPDRKAAIENIKAVYGIRSSFFHHGKTIDDEQSLITFMGNIWILIMTLIQGTKKYRTKEELISELENQRLT